MEPVSAQVFVAAKLPVLNPSEFELWKMWIEQYFLMTNYAIWEVILNGDSPLPTRTVDGVETSVPPTTAEQKLARKNELKARGTLLMALPNEHQLKFNTYKSAKTMMEAIEKSFGGNKESKKVQKILFKQQYKNFNGKSLEGLDQIDDRLQKLISQLEIHRETISQEDVNLKLLRSLPSEWKTHTLIWRNKPDLEDLSLDDLYNNLKIYEAEIIGTNEAVKTAHGVSDANSKNNASNLPNVDNLKQIDPDDLEEMDLKWQMAMLANIAKRFLKKTRRNLGVNGTDTIDFDKTKVECYNCHRRGHFARECMAPKNQDSKNRETTRRIVPVEETTSNALVSHSSAQDTENEAVFEEDIKILKLDIMLRDNALTKLRKKFEKAEIERDDLKLTLEKFENSSKNLSKLLDSQICDKFKSGVGYDSQVFGSQVFDSQVNDRYKISKGYHAIPPPYTGNFMRPKLDLVLADKGEYVFSESTTSVPSAATSEVKTSVSKPKSVGEPLIEDWISEVRMRMRLGSPLRRDKVTTAGPKAVVSDKKGNEANTIKALACWVWSTKNTKYLDHVIQKQWCQSRALHKLELQKKALTGGALGTLTGNNSTSYMSEKIDGGFCCLCVSQMCDKKNSVLFTDTECVVLSSDFKLTNENHVLLKVPRKDNMYSVDLRNVVFLKRCPVTILNTLDHLGKFDGKADEGFFVGYYMQGQAGRNNLSHEAYTATKQYGTPKSPISSSLKSSDDKVVDDVEKKTTEDPAKGDDKDDQDLREFESSPVNTAGTKDADVNSTNSIYTASPLVNFDGLSYFNANPPDDQKVPNLEDTGIFGGAYDDEDFVVGGDMNNLESFMPVSPIATTRVHKDHLVE
ncbi:putative ribonuclease H-like domain-containing protein [Tanacetum coccineum]